MTMSEESFEPTDMPIEPTDDCAERIDQLLGAAEAAGTDVERIELIFQIADIYECTVGDPRAALAALQAALRHDPASGRTVQAMERIARNHRVWGDLVTLTAEVASGLPDGKQSADLWVQVAFWQDSGLGALEDAAKAAVAALDLVPAHGGALAMLESIYRRQRNWDRLVEILDKRNALVGNDADRVAESYREVLRHDPQHRGALLSLVRAYEERGQWNDAANRLRILLGVLSGDATSEPARVDALHRVAIILRQRLGDARAAEERLVELLALPAGRDHVAAMTELASIYRERGDWLKARQLLERAAAAVKDAAAEARLLIEAGEICADRLAEAAQAADLFTQALALDPSRSDVTEKLADIRFQRGEWSALSPLLDRLFADEAAFEARAPDDRARLWYRRGRVAEEGGDPDRALESYRASLSAVSTGPAAVAARRALASLSFRQQAWLEAASSYDTLLSAPAGDVTLKRDETLEALERLGIARLRAGQPARAIEPLERALVLEPRRRRVLEALVEAAKASEEDDAIVRHSQALLAVTEDPAAKRELLEMVAAIHRERRHDPQRAIAAYREVLELWPDERSVMHRLLELLSETKQWRQAVQLLARLAELTESHLRAPYLVAAGNILAEELDAKAEAVEAYERALDCDPGDLKTFERVDRALTEARDWKTQERAYRRQIKRMGPQAAQDPGKRPVLLALWQGLGEIYRSRLKDLPAAIAALEVAAGLDPESVQRRRALAELHRASGPEGYGKAIAEHRALIGLAGTVAEMVPDLKILLRLFVEVGALDEAHGCAAALVLAGKADGDERALYDQYRSRGVIRARGRLNEELWQRFIYHPDEDRGVSQLLATVTPAVSLARAKPAKEVGLKKKQRHDVLSDPSVPCRALAYGVSVLGVAAPEVYLVPASPGEIDVANLRATMPGVPAATPALVIGGRLMAGALSDIDLAFVVGRTLAALRPDHILRWASFVPTLAELSIIVHAALRLTDPSRPPETESASEVSQYAAFLDRTLAPPLLEQLSVLVPRWRLGRDSQGNALKVDVARWARGAFLTTARAGLLLSGDLEGAVRIAQALAVSSGVDPADVTRDLTAWSISDPYFELRTQLGLRTVNLNP